MDNYFNKRMLPGTSELRLRADRCPNEATPYYELGGPVPDEQFQSDLSHILILTCSRLRSGTDPCRATRTIDHYSEALPLLPFDPLPLLCLISTLRKEV